MKNKRKCYAYGSMVRNPMYGGGMTMSANPMMDRKDKMGGMTPAMGMPAMRKGGKMKSHEQQESPAMERMEKKMKGYSD